MAQYDNFIENPIEGYGEDWRGHNGAEAQKFIEDKLEGHDRAIENLAPDKDLNPESDNAVANSAVTPEIEDLKAKALDDGDFVANDEGTEGTLTLYNKDREPVVSVRLPLGSASGGSTARTVLGLSSDTQGGVVREGDDVTLHVSYDHRYVGGGANNQSTGRKADLEIEVKNGQATTHTSSARNVAAGSTTDFMVPAEKLRAGDNDIYVRATVADPETGEKETRSAYMRIRVLSLSLATSFNMAAANGAGGYKPGDTVQIPYSVSGAGRKTVYLYIDGRQYDARTESRTGVTNGSFAVACTGTPIATLGRHNIQLVAEVEEEGVTVRSQSIYFDIWRTDAAGNSVPHVCLMIARPDGRVLGESEYMAPSLEAVQYETFSFGFTAYTPGSAASSVEIAMTGMQTAVLSPDRQLQTYAARFNAPGQKSLVISIAGGSPVTMGVSVSDSPLDVKEAMQGLLFKLDATGRSNSEADPAQWTAEDSNGVPVVSEIKDVAFSADGWDGTSLRLMNGGSLTVNRRLFENDIKDTGMTVEATVRVSSVIDPDAPVLTCIDNGKGIRITGNEAAFLTGEKASYPDPDNPDTVHEREVKLSSYFASDEWYKIAFVFSTAAQGRRMELFINGNRQAADIYAQDFRFQQDTPAMISVVSEGADVELRSMRVYTQMVTDDECVDNHIADIPTFEEMREACEFNNVLDQRGEIDIDKLIATGKGVIRIVRKGKLDDIYATNDKKADFLADVYFYSAFGPEHNFVLLNCYIRIQGTSSTMYPSKNIRVFFGKGSELRSMTGGMVVDGKKWPVRPGAVPVQLICLKSDYVDSSMASNTGGARIFNDGMLSMGLMTPPQRHQYEAAGEELRAVTVRSAIDGYPVDVFVSETADGEADYVGTYNLNNEKSKSGAVFGMEGVDGFSPSCPMALETLNNSERGCLFQSSDDADVEAGFDKAFEVNYGRDASGKVQSDGDVKWAGLHDGHKEAVLRLFRFIRECVPGGADAARLESFRSEKFREEAAEYMDVRYNIAYYLLTMRDAGVDQLAKNIIWRTWDGKVWYATYYDGDTRMGRRNDAFLKYQYNILRESRDIETDKYCFEGFHSWMWNLLLANFADVFSEMADRIETAIPLEKALQVYNVEQAGHWSDRAFNRSGYIKYIRPATVETYGKIWSFIFALSGSNMAHRTHFISNRYKLMSAMYGTSAHRADSIGFYLARTQGADSPDVVKVTAADVFSFGYGTNNRPEIFSTGLVQKGETRTVEIGGTFTVNDPLRFYGASRILSLDMTGACSNLKNGLDLSRCGMLQELDLSVPEGMSASAGWFLLLGSCRSIRRLNLNGQTGAKTSSSSQSIDLSALTRLESADLRGCSDARSVIFADGAPLVEARLPRYLNSVRMRNLRRLSDAGLSFEALSGLQEVEITGCPGIDSRSLVERILAEAKGLRSLVCRGIDWNGFSLADTLRLAGMKADVTGKIALPAKAAVSFEDKKRMIEAWGNVDSPDNPLYVTYTGAALVSVSIAGPRYIGETTPYDNLGKHRMAISPMPAAGNNFTSWEWSIEKNDFATIDPLTGVLNVTGTGSEDEAPKAEVTLRVTLLNGEALTATATVGFYRRLPKLGDYVFADGTTSDVPDLSKTVVGICFYIDPENPDVPGRRLCVKGRIIGSYAWGLAKLDNNSGFPSIELESRPGYSVFDIPGLDNVSSSGLNGNKVNESTYLDNATVDGFRRIGASYAAGQIGFRQISEPLGPCPAYSYIPYGLYNTLKIIAHRDIVLSGVGLEIPVASPGLSMAGHLSELMSKVALDNGNQPRYRQFYYPAASVCNAYEPTVKEGEALADCFRQGKWFLPSAGEVARICWYQSRGYDKEEKEDAIFAGAYNEGFYSPIEADTWTSTEIDFGSAFRVNFASRDVYTYGKHFSFVVRPVAAF